MNNFALILVVVCCLSLVFSIVTMILGVVILSKLKDVTRANRMQVMSQPVNMQQGAMVQRPNAPQNSVQPPSQGSVICRSCYSSIPDNVKVCPCCQASVDRR